MSKENNFLKKQNGEIEGPDKPHVFWTVFGVLAAVLAGISIVMGLYIIIFPFLGIMGSFGEVWYLSIIGLVGFGAAAFFIWSSKFLFRLKKAEAEVLREEYEEEKAEAEKYRREHPYPEAEELFKNVRAAGVSKLNSKADTSRLMLYAKNNKITMPRQELIDQFNLGKEYVERYEAEEEEAHENVLLAELSAQYTRYAYFTDRNKSIQYCQDKIKEAKEIIRQCKVDEDRVYNGGNATYRSAKQKESSWAVHGGIASGIAGTAAGMAVAIDTENKNRAKRQYNQELAKNVAAMSIMQLDQIWARKRSAEESLEFWEKQLEKVKMLLSSNVNENKLLNLLQPQVKEVEITKTGAVKLSVELNFTPDFKIFENVKAVVDGSIKVLIKVDDKVVGEAICVIPYGGVTWKRTVNGICCNPKQKAKNYTFEFVPNHLWAIEYM